MTEIGAFEAKNKLSALLDLVEKGQEITITRRGKPVARIVPASTAAGDQKAAAKSAAASIKRARKGVTLGGITLRELIEDGRK